MHHKLVFPLFTLLLQSGNAQPFEPGLFLLSDNTFFLLSDGSNLLLAGV